MRFRYLQNVYVLGCLNMLETGVTHELGAQAHSEQYAWLDGKD